MASFKNMAIGDIAILRIDSRMVMVIINQPLQAKLYLSDYPMVAQVICDDKNLPKFLPIIYYNDGYKEKITDIVRLHFLYKLFAKEALAVEVIRETELLALGKIEQRNASLVLKLMNCKAQIPTNNQESTQTCVSETSEGGQLLIVEQYFTEKMKQEFYDNLTLGLSERESLVKIRRKYPKVFSKILTEFKDKDIYTRL